MRRRIKGLGAPPPKLASLEEAEFDWEWDDGDGDGGEEGEEGE